MDAMLGAAALGDIGVHFPDSDESLRGISSLVLLTRTAGLVKNRGYALCNADITIVAQAPRLAEYIPAMLDNLASALGCSASRLNVKATTEEKLGFTGEGKGIAAHAVVLLEET
jgi:2-C-methyl-D-erythritol 2,4-cyclodiphosphate synthase